MAATGLDFNHVLVYVRDVEKSLGFYRDLLGFEAVDVWLPDYARLKSPKGTTTIALHTAGKGRRRSPRAEGIRLYFEVRDVDALCARLASKGVRFDQMPKDMEWGWRHAYLRDPDGHEVSLYRAGQKRLRKTQ